MCVHLSILEQIQLLLHICFFSPIHFDSAESINKSDYGTKTVWCNLNTNSLVFIRLRANKWNFISFQANATGLVFCNMEWAIITRRFSFGANDDNRIVTILIFRFFIVVDKNQMKLYTRINRIINWTHPDTVIRNSFKNRFLPHKIIARNRTIQANDKWETILLFVISIYILAFRQQ